MSSIIRLRSGLTVLVSLMESSFLFEACSTSILRTGALHCYHYYILSTGSRPLGSCSRTAGWSAATSCLVQVFGRRRRRSNHALWRPAAEKRQCTKSRREIVGLRCRRRALRQERLWRFRQVGGGDEVKVRGV